MQNILAPERTAVDQVAAFVRYGRYFQAISRLFVSIISSPKTAGH